MKNTYSILAALALSALSLNSELNATTAADLALFTELNQNQWESVFFDPCDDDWTKNWFIDGQNAQITHSANGMHYSAGNTKPVVERDHAVLWTKMSFADADNIKIEYEFTKMDDEIQMVNIIYILATGFGQGDYVKDISAWADLRKIASMDKYYNYMNTLHVSYSAFDMVNSNPDKDYIRARRYRPELKKGLNGTDLNPDYFNTGLFEKGVPHQITFIKTSDELFMHIRNDEKEYLCKWIISNVPALTEGRIGLRHMFTRSSLYRDFRVSVISSEPSEPPPVSYAHYPWVYFHGHDGWGFLHEDNEDNTGAWAFMKKPNTTD